MTEQRRAFVDFVRTHHPDVGGDPAVFRAGLEALRARRAGPPRIGSGGPVGRAGRIEVHRRRRGPGVLLDWLDAARERRRRPPRVY